MVEAWLLASAMRSSSSVEFTFSSAKGILIIVLSTPEKRLLEFWRVRGGLSFFASVEIVFPSKGILMIVLSSPENYLSSLRRFKGARSPSSQSK